MKLAEVFTRLMLAVAGPVVAAVVPLCTVARRRREQPVGALLPVAQYFLPQFYYSAVLQRLYRTYCFAHHKRYVRQRQIARKT